MQGLLRYRYLSYAPLQSFFPTAHLFCLPFVWMIEGIDYRSGLNWNGLRYRCLRDIHILPSGINNPYDQSFRHQRFISTAHLSSFYLPLGRWEVSVKRIIWDIDNLLFLFPFLPPSPLSGRAEELIAEVDWDYRYRCLSGLHTLFGPYFSLLISFLSPFYFSGQNNWSQELTNIWISE